MNGSANKLWDDVKPNRERAQIESTAWQGYHPLREMSEDLGLGLKRRVVSCAVTQHKSCRTEEERTSITRCSLFFKTHISCIFWLGPTALRLAQRINQGLHVCSPAGRLSKTHACTKINKPRRAWKRLNWRRRSSWSFAQSLTQSIKGASKYSGDLKIRLNKQPLPERRLILPELCKAQSQDILFLSSPINQCTKNWKSDISSSKMAKLRVRPCEVGISAQKLNGTWVTPSS